MVGLLIAAAAVMSGGPAVGHPAADAGSYRWVNPPKSRANDNVEPQGRQATFAAGTLIREFWTPDLQLTLYWPESGLGGDEVTLDVVPLDPAGLAPLPSGLSPSGNAYRIELRPRGRFLRPATVSLIVPDESPAVYHSNDGRSWRQLRTADSESGVVAAEFVSDGYLVAVKDRDGASTSSAAVAFGVVGTGAVLLFEVRRRKKERRAGEVPSAV